MSRLGHQYVDDRYGSVRHEARMFLREVSQRLLLADQDRPAERVASHAVCRAVIAMAATDPRHAVTLEDFDRDPWELNTPGGVVDLRSGNLRPHVKADRFTKAAAVAPGGECPRWLAFLHEITRGDAAVIEYLQRWVGYSLTGTIRDHAIAFVTGPGENGKSVLLGTVGDLLQTYAITAAPELICETRNERHQTHLAALRGARFVSIGETEEGKPWAEARLKSLSGGDQIEARKMHQDTFNFTPVAKIWIAGNHRPPLRNVDAAMKRRLHIIPFEYRPARPDTTLRESPALWSSCH